MKQKTTSFFTFILILLPFVGLSYNLFFLPQKIASAGNRNNYLEKDLLQKVHKSETRITKFAHEVIGIDKNYKFKPYLRTRNLIRNKFEIDLMIFYPDTHVTPNGLFQSEKFQVFFDQFPDLILKDIDYKHELIIEYTFEFISKSGSFFELPMLLKKQGWE